jgi:hypothetical protein
LALLQPVAQELADERDAGCRGDDARERALRDAPRVILVRGNEGRDSPRHLARDAVEVSRRGGTQGSGVGVEGPPKRFVLVRSAQFRERVDGDVA